MRAEWHEFRFQTTASPEVAFGVVADLSRLPEWDPPVQTSTLLRGDGGPGSIWRATTRLGPMRVEVRTEIVDVDAPSRIAMHVTARYLDERVEWSVVRAGRGAEVTLRTHHRFSGPARPMNLLLPVVGRPMQDASMRRLRRCIEATATRA